MKVKIEKETKKILKELQMEHNHTWYEELFQRNHRWLNDIALFYRGNNISYSTMFKYMEKYARALRYYGIKMGSEVPVCMANIPEFVYLLGALSMIGAKINSFGDEFDKDYITEIINESKCELFFCDDFSYGNIMQSVCASKVKKIIIISLTDSLPNRQNPYETYDKKHGRICNRMQNYLKCNTKIISAKDFLDEGQNYKGELQTNCGLDTEFIISYTSGSTNSEKPKAIVHTTRSLITIGRCHDPEVQKTTSLKNFTIQTLIPSHSNSDIIAGISDALMQGSKLALEPIYDRKFFLDTLLINRPNYVSATRSFWIQVAKQIYVEQEYRKIGLPFLLLAFAVGEPLEKNEERFINRAMHRVKAGTEMIPLPFSVMMISTAGGDCEHGGIFYNLFRGIQNLKPSNLLHRQEQGLKPFGMVDVAVLDTKGRRCKPYQLGRLVANSPCNMKEYKNNPEATANFFIKDADGKAWGDCKVYSYIDRQGGIHIKGRIPDNKHTIPLFEIAEIILKDRKHILSCEVVEKDGNYVVHVEFQLEFCGDARQILIKAQKRCKKVYGSIVSSKLYWRIRDNTESFPLTGCGKRNVKALVEEGISSKCFKLSD